MAFFGHEELASDGQANEGLGGVARHDDVALQLEEIAEQVSVDAVHGGETLGVDGADAAGGDRRPGAIGLAGVLEAEQFEDRAIVALGRIAEVTERKAGRPLRFVKAPISSV